MFSYSKLIVSTCLLFIIVFLGACAANTNLNLSNDISLTSSKNAVSEISVGSSNDSATQTTSFSTIRIDKTNTTNSLQFNEGEEQSNDIVMYTEQKSYPANVEVICVIIESRDGKGFSFDRLFEVEKNEDSNWAKVPFKKDAIFQGIAYKAMPNPDTGIAKRKEDIELNKLQEKLTKGNYRISKKVGKQTVYAEFIID